MLETHDSRDIRDNDQLRTIQVPSLGVGVTDFDLDKDSQMKLYQSGIDAAEKFFKDFSFNSYLSIRTKKVLT